MNAILLSLLCLCLLVWLFWQLLCFLWLLAVRLKWRRWRASGTTPSRLPFGGAGEKFRGKQRVA